MHQQIIFYVWKWKTNNIHECTFTLDRDVYDKHSSDRQKTI